MPSRIRVFSVAALAALSKTSHAAASPMPRNWHAPHWWLAQAVCIHDHEGAWPDNTGNTYFGGLQFLPNTWYRAGGAHYAAFDHPGDRRYPFTAPIREQLYRAWVIFRKYKTSWRRGSWSEWGTRGKCNLE